MPSKPKPSTKIPGTLGACADLLYTTRQTRLTEGKTLKEYEETEKVLKDHLIATLPKSDANGVSGRVARVTIVSKAVPVVEDWDAFYAFVRKAKRFDLLQRRLNDEAVKEMWDNNKTIPGVGVFNAVGVSVNKI
jgi:hypothetical protein